MDSLPPKLEHVGNTDLPPQRKSLYCVWRQASKENQKVYLHLVDPSQIELDDIIFVESSGFKGYAHIMDFVRHSDGTLSDFMLKNADIDFETSMLLAKTTRNAIDKLMSSPEDGNLCVIVCLKQGIPKGNK